MVVCQPVQPDDGRRRGGWPRGSSRTAPRQRHGPCARDRRWHWRKPAVVRRGRRDAYLCRAGSAHGSKAGAADSRAVAGVELVQAPAEELPFAEARFDTVVSTLVLCTVSDQARALREVRRVLRPGGRLLFIEHVRSEEPRLASWQDRLNGLNRVIAHGCICNRSTLDAIRAAGFTITSVERHQMPKAPPFVRPLVVGRAESNAAR